MLTRPTTRHDTASTAERAQLAAIFGLVGIFSACLIVAAAFWLSQLQGRIQEQTESLKESVGPGRAIVQSQASRADHSSAERRLVSDVLDKVRSGQEICHIRRCCMKSSTRTSIALTQPSHKDSLRSTKLWRTHQGARSQREHRIRARQYSKRTRRLQDRRTRGRRAEEPDRQPQEAGKATRWIHRSDTVDGEKKSIDAPGARPHALLGLRRLGLYRAAEPGPRRRLHLFQAARRRCHRHRRPIDDPTHRIE